jgi:hypothetical protein
MLLNFIIIFSMLLLAPGCTSVPRAFDRTFSLVEADQVTLGITLSSEVEKLFGSPSHKFSDQQRGIEIWSYCESEPCSSAKLSINFDAKSKVAKEVVWNSSKLDPALDPKLAMRRYGTSDFSDRRLLVDFGTHMYTVETSISPGSGVVMEYDSARSKVVSVQRKRPGNFSELAEIADTGLPRIKFLPTRTTAAGLERK